MREGFHKIVKHKATRPDLVKSEGSSWEALSPEVLGDGVQVEHSLMDLIDGVLWVNRWQLLSREHLFGGFNHALSVVVTQLHTGADDCAAEPLAQDLEGGQVNQWDKPGGRKNLQPAQWILKWSYLSLGCDFPNDREGESVCERIQTAQLLTQQPRQHGDHLHGHKHMKRSMLGQTHEHTEGWRENKRYIYEATTEGQTVTNNGRIWGCVKRHPKYHIVSLILFLKKV